MKKSCRFLISSALCCALSFFTCSAQAVNVGDMVRVSNMGALDTDVNYLAIAPSIAYNSTDNQYLVVWYGDDNSGALVDNENEVWGQLLDADGSEIGDDFRISDMGIDGNTAYGAINPKVAYNSTDNQYLVVWYGDDNSGALVDNENEVWAQLVDADGSEIGSDFRVSQMGPDGNTSYAGNNTDLAYNSTNNEYLVVWEGSDNSGALVTGEFEIWGQLIAADGTLDVAGKFRVSNTNDDGDANFDAFSPAVAYNSTDNGYLVVWHSDTDSVGALVDNEFEVWGQLLDDDGVELGSDFRMSDMGTDGSTSYWAVNADVAYNSTDNQYLVTWWGDDNSGSLVDGEFEVWAQLVDADGSDIGSDFRVSDMGGDGNASYRAEYPKVAYNSLSNLYLVVWEGDDNTDPLVDNEFEAWGQLIDADGTEIESDTRMSSVGSDGDTSYVVEAPVLAWNSTDNQFLIAWDGDDDSLADNAYEIWGQLFNNPIPCSLGYYSATGDDAGDRDAGCTICDAGTYQNFTGQTECNPCPAGYFQANLGSIVCYECAPGTVQPDTGQASCDNCPAGQYQDEAAQLTCDLCAAGTFQADEASITCNQCNYGTVQPDAGQASCDNCPAGYYQDALGQTSCTLCAADTFAAVAGAASCEACAEGFTSDEGALECSEIVDNSGGDDTADETAAASSGCQLVLPKM